jgi:hypothetical protein
MMRHMRPNGDRSTTDHATGHESTQRYTIPEAAKALRLTEEAVRQRVKRGTLNSVKVDGSLFVLLESDTSSDRSSEQEQPANDGSINRPNDTSRLVDVLEGEVAHLRRQLEQANERDRENRRIIAALTGRIPELPPGSLPKPREPDLTAPEEPGGARGRPVSQEPEQQRSWLYRFFFGA